MTKAKTTTDTNRDLILFRAAIPAEVKRTEPVTDLLQLVADFWPQDETADDINTYIAMQRTEDRTH